VERKNAKEEKNNPLQRFPSEQAQGREAPIIKKGCEKGPMQSVGKENLPHEKGQRSGTDRKKKGHRPKKPWAKKAHLRKNFNQEEEKGGEVLQGVAS